MVALEHRRQQYPRGSRCGRGTDICLQKGAAGSVVEPADHALGRSRGGWGTKLHLICDGGGIPLAVRITAGQASELAVCEPLTDQTLAAWPRPPEALAGDKGFGRRSFRRFLEDHQVEPVIPHRRHERALRGGADPLNLDLYRRRNLVERCIGWLKQSRAVATRYDKLARNFLGTLRLAFIRRYLRLLAGSSDTT